ncbi:hypothetical protein [Nostoc sp. UHCC 0870]|uniref:hypothetical protein n=1 Tax=Nostoc sp. UHCC 0870 TaxID=2914041 RepID=UPI001EE0FA65|nr:hypothetical protein [Nostoc sp. UHCC 0870]UKP01115.1 hypothetical protein L6494_27540 [Nostoc sp. UHCC 0870]
MSKFNKNDRVKTPVGDGSVIGCEYEWEMDCTWVQVELDSPVTQKGCHGDAVTQYIGEFRDSNLEKID